MKRTWLVWAMVGAVVITVLIAFNYERGKDVIPLTEVFHGKDLMNNTVEYEFFDSDEKAAVSTDHSVVSSVPTETLSVSPELGTVSSKKLPISSSSQPVSVESKQKTVEPVPMVSKQSVNGKRQKTPSIIKPVTTVSSSKTGVATSGKTYTIQIVAFKEQSRANKAAEQAKQKGYSPFIDQQHKSDGSVLYQICIGKFDGYQAAKEFLVKVKKDYQDGYIKSLMNP